MNIFHLDTNPKTCAEYHCDKHVCKMIVETTQMLCTAYQRYNGLDSNLYKMGFKNHPMTLWVGNSWKHYEWTVQLLFFLLCQYTHGYKKTHKATEMFERLTGRDNAGGNLSDEDALANVLSEFPAYMGEEIEFAERHLMSKFDLGAA